MSTLSMSSCYPADHCEADLSEGEADLPEIAAYQCVAGVDVSKAALDFQTSSRSLLVPKKGRRSCTKGHQQFQNDPAGIKALIQQVRARSIDIVVLEASGGYQDALVTALHAARIAVHVANPRQVRDFARASGVLAKTDQVDAAILAQYGLTMCPEPTPSPDPDARVIGELQARHRQLTGILTAEKNRLHTAPAHLKEDVREHIEWLQDKLEALQDQLAQKIEANAALKRVSDLLRTMPGVGPKTVPALLGGLPELGARSAKQLAALVGVAPYPCESGQYKGKRRIFGGRSSVRCALYMVVINAIRLTDVFKTYYHRLLAAGKLKKVALTACIRKLVTILNAMVKSGKNWEQNAVTA